MEKQISMLTAEDSKRVADSLIEMIEKTDIAKAVSDAIRATLQPDTHNGWKKDWFPLTVEDMCDKIQQATIDAVWDVANKQGKNKK